MKLLAAIVVLGFLAVPVRAEDEKSISPRPSLFFLSSHLRLTHSIPEPEKPKKESGLRSQTAKTTKFEKSPMVRLAQFFIDEVPIAHIGSLQIKLKIILK